MASISIVDLFSGSESFMDSVRDLSEAELKISGGAGAGGSKSSKSSKSKSVT